MPLTNAQYNELMRVYEDRQLKNRDRERRRFERIYKEIPEVQEVDHSISSASLSQARRMLEGDAEAITQLKEQIQKLRQKKQDLLLSHGFPADYLEPIYDCPDCQDTGYIDGRKCHCFQKAIIHLFYQNSHLAGVLEEENFEHFNLNYYSAEFIDSLTGRSARALAEEALEACKNYVQDFNKKGGNLLLFGPTGCGKTFLTHCVARDIMQSSHSVLYLTATEFIDALTANAFGQDDESGMLCEQIQSCDLLILDDLGTERNTEFTVSRLFVCLNDRILSGKSTIISTNYNLSEIRTYYTERIFSRISNHYRMLRLSGEDIRIRKKLMHLEDH